MAQRRMFSPQIVDSDAFLDMPQSSQLLYFHFGMRADDDGFVGNPKKIMRMIGGADDDLKILVAKRFLLLFETGVVVIKHWRIHNQIRADRYHETQYLDEKGKLILKENGSYTELRQPNGNQLETEVRLGKVSIGKKEEETTTPIPEKPKKEKKPKKKEFYQTLEYLKNIPEEEVKEFVFNFKAGEFDVRTKGKALYDYVLANGKEGKYKDFRAFLRNALRKDFGEKTQEQRERDKDIAERLKATQARKEVGTATREPVREPTPEEAKQNLERLRVLKQGSGIGKFGKV